MPLVPAREQAYPPRPAVPQHPVNTVKGYADHLTDWFAFLQLRGLDLRMVQLEDLGGLLAWPRLPPRSATAVNAWGGSSRGRRWRIGLCSSAHHQWGARQPVAPQPEAVDTDPRDATVRLTLNPRRTPARGPDGWTGWAPARCCCAPSPTRPRLGPGPSSTSSRGFGPTVTIDR
jgi:hypothetical protein